jgi:hypothetical protein
MAVKSRMPAMLWMAVAGANDSLGSTRPGAVKRPVRQKRSVIRDIGWAPEVDP